MKDIIELTIVKWVDPEGIEKREIGRLLVRQTGEGEFSFDISEGSHPLVPTPLRHRGSLRGYPCRQSVWGLVMATLSEAIGAKLTH